MKDTDAITTGLGVLMAAGTAAQPVLNGVQGSMHGGDWVQLGVSVLMAIFGFFTNKKGATNG